MGHRSAAAASDIDLSRYWLPYQKRLIRDPARFTHTNWSRQIGKSTASTFRRVLRGVQRRRNQIFLSAGERQSRELMMKARQHVQVMHLAFEYLEQDVVFEGATFKQLEIGLPALGMRIIALPANPNTARGFTGDVLLDEFALHKQDRDIWGSAFPTVLRGDGELDICSTPKGRQNMFYRLADNDQFSHSTVTIHEAVAQGLDVKAEQLRLALNDDELWRQEFLCEFVDEATAFLTYEQICECEDGDSPLSLDLAALAEHRGDVVVGIDVARKKHLTVIWAFEVDGRVLRSLGMIELRNETFRAQFEHFSNVLRCRCVRRCAIDASGLGMQMGQDLATDFGAHAVEPCTLTAPFKEKIANLMRNKFIDKLIRVPVSDKVRNDLHSVRKIVTAAGNIRLDAPEHEGSHADRFWAAALAVYAGSEASGPIEVTMGPPLRTAGLRGM